MTELKKVYILKNVDMLMGNFLFIQKIPQVDNSGSEQFVFASRIRISNADSQQRLGINNNKINNILLSRNEIRIAHPIYSVHYAKRASMR